MIAFVEGTLEYVDEGAAVVNCGGVGYRVFTPVRGELLRIAPGSPVRFYTALSVREDAMMLYGFLDRESLNVYKQLVAVSGVGPKFALALLTSFSAAELATAIAAEDKNALSSVPGIGKKTAERIILELKDKLRISVTLDLGGEGKAPGAEQTEAMKNALSVLINLGYSQTEATAAVRAVAEPGMSAERIIETCMTEIF